MDRPEIVLVVAVADNGVIGHDGAMPWHISADFRRLKALTMGKPLVMGRKTFDSLPGILPGRRHIVITRDPDWQADGKQGNRPRRRGKPGTDPVKLSGTMDSGGARSLKRAWSHRCPLPQFSPMSPPRSGASPLATWAPTHTRPSPCSPLWASRRWTS